MTNIPTSTQSVSDLDAQVAKMLKEFDITKMQEIGYDNIQQIADKYLASEDQGLKEIGQELKDIDPKIFELTPAEEELKRVCDIVMKSGATKEEADRFGIIVLQTAVKKATQDIIESMNEKTLAEWQALQSYDPNVLQQMYLLDETAKMLLHKTYDQLYEEALTTAIKMATSLLSEKKASAPLVENITEEQAQSVMSAFNSKQYEIAIQLIYKFAQENGRTN